MSLKQLFISMEDDTLNETDLVVAADDTIEIEIADAAEAEHEAEEQSDNVEELGEISEGLESILISMESAMQDGGLSPQSALFMQHAVQAHVGRLGMSAGDVTPSMESFGGASGQAAATTISMEGVGDTIKKIWLAIKNAVAKAIQAVKNFFAKIFGGVGKLKSRIDSLKTTVAGLTAFDGSDIKVPNANTLRYKGKADISSIINGLKATDSQLGKVVPDMINAANDFYVVKVARILSRSEMNEEAKEALQDELANTTEETTQTIAKIVQVSNVISGDAVLRGSATANSEHGAATNVKAPRLVKGFGFKAIDDSATEAKAPSKSEMETILKLAADMVAKLEDRKKGLEGLTKAREEASKKTDAKVDGWMKKIKAGASAAVAGTVMRVCNVDLAAPINQTYSHSFNVTRAALALVERAIVSHKAGPGKKK